MGLMFCQDVIVTCELRVRFVPRLAYPADNPHQQLACLIDAACKIVSFSAEHAHTCMQTLCLPALTPTRINAGTLLAPPSHPHAHPHQCRRSTCQPLTTTHPLAGILLSKPYPARAQEMCLPALTISPPPPDPVGQLAQCLLPV
jgi:hypothetical protein